MPKPPQTPFDKVREAFAELDASEKTAFVLEATFAAVGEGIAETGRRFSGAVQDIDDLFTADHRKADAEAPPANAPKANTTAGTTTSGTTPGATASGPARKTKPKPGSTAKPSSKTAGKAGRKPKGGDDA